MHKHDYKGHGKVEHFYYDGKNKQVNKLTLKIMIGGLLFLIYLAWLGSQGVVLHF